MIDIYILVLHICELDYSRCKLDYYSNIIVACELDYLRCHFLYLLILNWFIFFCISSILLKVWTTCSIAAESKKMICTKLSPTPISVLMMTPISVLMMKSISMMTAHDI